MSYLTDTQEAAAQQALESLDNELGSAWSTVASSSSLFNGEQRATVLANLEDDRKLIERLGGVQLDQVREGKTKFAGWVETATLIHKDISFQVGLTDKWALTGLLWDVLHETAKDVKTGVTDTVAAVGGGTGIGVLIGLGLVIAIAWKLK